LIGGLCGLRQENRSKEVRRERSIGGLIQTVELAAVVVDRRELWNVNSKDLGIAFREFPPPHKSRAPKLSDCRGSLRVVVQRETTSEGNKTLDETFAWCIRKYRSDTRTLVLLNNAKSNLYSKV
jgi:hypothetical protein